MDAAILNHRGMPPRPKNSRRLQRRGPLPLYIGQWIRALGMRQIDIVKATGMNEGYLSELCNGTSTKVPSYEILAGIADAMGIPIDYLRRPPPDQQFIDGIRGLDPTVLARLRRQ